MSDEDGAQPRGHARFLPRQRSRPRGAAVSDNEEVRRSSMVVMEEDVPVAHNSDLHPGLHHRAVHHHSEAEEEEDANRTRAEEQKRLRFKQRLRRKALEEKGTPKDRILRIATGIVVLYFLLVCKTYFSVPKEDREGSLLSVFGSNDPRAEKRRQVRMVLDQQEWQEREQMGRKLREQAERRRRRTRLPSSQSGAGTSPIIAPSSYIHDVNEEERRMFPGTQQLENNMPKAKALENICGFVAQKAALEAPNSFHAKDALDKHARVWINGLLTPVGIHLAIALKERCGVPVVGGIDAMYPNTIPHRLSLLEPLEILRALTAKQPGQMLSWYPAVDPKVFTKANTLAASGELNPIKIFNPTHIVHLASYAPEQYLSNDPATKNSRSPHVSKDDDNYQPALFAMKSSMSSMEHVLAAATSVPRKDRPHVTFASSNAWRHWSTRKTDQIHAHMSTVDEVLADTYHGLYGTYSVAMRLPEIYGPWGHPQSDIYQILESLLSGNQTANDTSLTDAAVIEMDQPRDLMYVSDVVDALIAAMQYRNPAQKPMALELSMGKTSPLQNVRDAAEMLLTTASNDTKGVPAVLAQKEIRDAKAVTKQTVDSLNWKPTEFLLQGLLKTMAWHLDRRHAGGGTLPAVSDAPERETGDLFLSRHGEKTCPADEIECHASRAILPCATECSVKNHCVSSVFDPIVELMEEVTGGCDIVAYTQLLGNDVDTLELEAEYMDEGDPLICNFAFVSAESKLVSKVIEKVPLSELRVLGVEPKPEDAGKVGAIQARKLEKLNGRLLYRGWVLVWVKNTPDPLPISDQYLLKLAPDYLFSKDVHHAMFIDQRYGASPTTDDIQFLVDEMYRSPWRKRTVKHKTDPPAKIRLPAEPRRRAVILLSQLKYTEDPDEEPYDPDSKVMTTTATRFMRYENGEFPVADQEPFEIQVQRTQYERAQAVINRDLERDPDSPFYVFNMEHWASTNWVVHDLELAEGKRLRCEWLQQQIQFQSDLDQLGFAYVMAKMDLQRKLAHEEDDQKIRNANKQNIDMKKLLTDVYEWTPLQTEQNRPWASSYDELRILPFNLPDTIIEENDPLPDPPEVDRDTPTPLFVRIMSDRVMAFSRKAWDEVQAEIVRAEEEEAKAQ